ncbi:DUF4136 domain-containing protein [Methylomarinum sp. Ch1-1]|uniref:DUF4136 domain-containing protein n=1 Tax=Methylomarinum roseum TaxID=3067653 RepID=A0AAU7NXG0_9GAMM|nr:DUF4136 domain-containing protein [Methylomarinum sp. Ch1-1]MDP4522235.1 DUF4136 domain-containing protein [Methylomarinum sp. Ch1-1]
MNRKALLIFPLFLLLSSCATVKVDVDYDGAADFSQLKRYAWLEEKPPSSGNTLLDTNNLLHDRIHQGIDAWFARHGYRKTEVDEADFLVLYRVVVENKTRVTVLSPYYDYPYSWRFGYHRYYYSSFSSFAWSYYPEHRVYEYQRGTLIIDIVDPKSKKLLWRGMAYEDISPHTTQEKKQRYVGRAIKSILAKFPPGDDD